jgi:hypothetical protein
MEDLKAKYSMGFKTVSDEQYLAATAAGFTKEFLEFRAYKWYRNNRDRIVSDEKEGNALEQQVIFLESKGITLEEHEKTYEFCRHLITAIKLEENDDERWLNAYKKKMIHNAGANDRRKGKATPANPITPEEPEEVLEYEPAPDNRKRPYAAKDYSDMMDFMKHGRLVDSRKT